MDEVDRIRLEQFRQMRREIRGSEGYLVVGIDVGKEKHHAFFGTATGKTLSPNPHGWRHYYASKLVAEGKSLIEVQNSLGHENAKTTSIYLHELLGS